MRNADDPGQRVYPTLDFMTVLLYGFSKDEHLILRHNGMLL